MGKHQIEGWGIEFRMNWGETGAGIYSKGRKIYLRMIFEQDDHDADSGRQTNAFKLSEFSGACFGIGEGENARMRGLWAA